MGLREVLNVTEKNKLMSAISIIAIIISIISVIVAGLAVYFAHEANEHTKIVEQSTLQIGHVKYFNNTILIHLINGYYSRYPAFIVGGKYCIPECCENIEITHEKNEWNLVERDKPVILSVQFNESALSNITDGAINLTIEIRYVDFGEMTQKSVTAIYEVDILDNTIKHVNLINVDRKTLRKIE